MARTALLVLLVLAGVAACAATPRWIRLSDDKPDEPSCLTYSDEDSCLAHGCGWCSSQALGASAQGCVAESIAKLVPKSIADCKLPEPAPSADDDDDDDTEEEQEQTTGDLGKKKHKPKPKPAPPATCADNKDRRDCLKLGADEGECAWCEGSYMPASCMTAMAAKYLPEMVAKCKLPKKHKAEALTEDGPDDPPKPKPPTSCGDNTDKHACLDLGAQEGDCAWCVGDNMPASCVGVKAAQWIPEQVAKCKMPKKHKADNNGDDADANSALEKRHKKKKERAATCMDIKDARDCVKRGADEGECAWCGAKFPGMPDTCVEVSKAKFIPETVATCKMPKSTVSSGSGGGYPGGGGDYPSGGGDYPGPPGGGGGQGQGCMALKSRKKCLKGTDTEACAWCGASSYLGSPCVSESTAKYIPSFTQKCKMGRKKKSSNNADDELLAVA